MDCTGGDMGRNVSLWPFALDPAETRNGLAEVSDFPGRPERRTRILHWVMVAVVTLVALLGFLVVNG